jgi:hypothetical protein
MMPIDRSFGDLMDILMPTGTTAPIRRRPIKSSNVEWIGWPTTGEPLMVVHFKGGSRYGYLGVSRQRAIACAYAKSTGEYLAKKIKPNYRVVKLR